MVWTNSQYKTRLEEALKIGSPVTGKWTVDDPAHCGSPDGFFIKFMESRIPTDKEPYLKQFSCVLQKYPACCMLVQMNFFRYWGEEQEIHSLIDHMLRVMRENYSRSYASKLMLNTVQYQNTQKRLFLQEDLNINSKDILDGNHIYPFIYSWCKKQKDMVDHPFVNQNTGNIIHNIVVRTNGSPY